MGSVVLGAIAILVGAVWILQGAGVLPGSFMTGQTKWAIYGGIAIVAGLLLLIAPNRRPTV